LRSNKLTFGGVTNMEGYSTVSLGGITYMVVPTDKQGWFSIDSVDLAGVNGAELEARWQSDDDAPKNGYVFELRTGAPDGQKISEAVMDKSIVKDKQHVAYLRFSFPAISNAKKQNLYVISVPKDKSESSTIGLSTFALLAN
ncbi:MAG: hypothetical protein IT250_10690, partial [Chitinophagaceae bacterium]|nr:hypothetical protein [Chitinophagaceae bacterium]